MHSRCVFASRIGSPVTGVANLLRAFREARKHDRRTSSAAPRAKRIACMHVQARLAAQCTHCAKRGITCRANAATASARHSICTRRHHAGKRFRRQGAHCTARSRHSLPKNLTFVAGFREMQMPTEARPTRDWQSEPPVNTHLALKVTQNTSTTSIPKSLTVAPEISKNSMSSDT